MTTIQRIKNRKEDILAIQLSLKVELGATFVAARIFNLKRIEFSQSN